MQLKGQVPLAIGNAKTAVGPIKALGAVFANSSISLNFGLPLGNVAALNGLIVAEAKTHKELSRAQIYQRFSPPVAQYQALRNWLIAEGYTITHVGADRLEMTAKAPAAVVEKSLEVKLQVYRSNAYMDEGVLVGAQDFYANTTAPVVPARLGVQSISGLSNIDQFFTDIQLGKASAASDAGGGNGTDKGGIKYTRTGGYYPSDLQSMYDVQGTYGYGTGQTMGFTLWGAGEVQAATTEFATVTGQPALTVDTACTASGNSPTSPSSCTATQEQPNHLLNILENGNTNNAYGGNDETGLDVETSHGMAPGVAEKYYLGDCSATPSPGTTNGDNCNGSDVGLEDAIEDAANDPTLHSVSNSWGYGGDTEWGAQDPFELATNNSLAIAAAAGTTFYFSTGDDGTYESGYPADSPYVVAVGGTSLFSSQSLTSTSGTTATLSTEDTWAAGGSWCSNVEPRPAWQNGAGVTANATCPGRAIPDISAIADTNTAVYEVYSTGASTYRTGSVGGTSVAGPVMNGMEADTENFVADQPYPGGTVPATGFEGPIMYEMGNSGDYSDYFRDVLCGNDADPSGGPDGEAAQPGWDEATGWGAINWLDYSTGYAMTLGATGLTTPASNNQNYQWSCAKTPGNSTEHGISFPTSSVGFAVGTASSSPWESTYLPSRAWGASNTFYTTTNGGTDWVPSNSDMLAVTCTSVSTCIEVGDGGVIKVTTDGGAVWTADATEFNQALTQVTCPSSSECFAAGDRGTVLESTNGGITWSYSASVDGNPIYGLSCPSTSDCYAVDNYGHVMTTTNGGASWTLESTPVTAPGVNVPGSGGPVPYSGLFGVSCATATTCVAVGGYPQTGQTAAPIVTTTDGTDWTLQNSGVASADNLMGVSCVSGTTTCYAVGFAGTIVTTTNLTTWTPMTSNTTEPLIGVTCLSTSYCVAIGEAGTIDVLSGGTWSMTSTTLGTSAFLAGVTCATANDCFAVGKQGVTLNFDSTNVAGTVTQLAGGGTTQTMDALSCTSASDCEAVGGAGTILGTTNGGQTWLPQTSGVSTSVTLEGVSCSGSDCVAVGTSGTIIATTNGGATWATQTSGVTVTLEAVSCSSMGCVVVGNAPTSGTGTILTSANGGGTWTASASGVTGNLDGVTCVSTSCWAVGAIPTGSTTAAIVASTNSGSTWTVQTSNAPLALSSVACFDALDCFAGGSIGTVMATNNGGSNWYQEGNPISGPTTALNAGPTSITAIDGVACSSTACFMATGSSGNIMMSPVLSVTVVLSGPYGTTPDVSALTANTSGISYNPSSEAADVTGGLTCSTTATASSNVGSYPISGCSGLFAPGYNVVYNYAASSYNVTQDSNVITFASIPPQTYGNPSFQIDPTASSGLPVSVASSGDCSLDSPTAPADVTITGGGSCSITATQGGNTNYAPATPVSQNFLIATESQQIDFTTISPQTYGDPAFEIDPTATSGLPVSLSSTGQCTLSSDTSPANVTMTGGGQCSITASQGGNSDYSPATNVTETFSILLQQTITFGSLSDVTYGASPISLDASASSGLPVTYYSSGDCTVDGSTLTITGAGSCSVVATQSGNSEYNPAPDVEQSFSIAQANQTITFNGLTDQEFSGNTFIQLTATSDSGLPVSYTVGANDQCLVSGSTLEITGAGSCSVTASQSGNNDYNPATPVTQGFSISQGTPTIEVTATPAEATVGSVTYDVYAMGVATSPPTGSVTVSDGTNSCSIPALSDGSGQCAITEAAGSYTVTAAYSGDTNYTPATGALDENVGQATPALTITPPAVTPTIGPVSYRVSATGVTGFAPTGSVTVSDGSSSCNISSFSQSGTCSLTEGAGTYTVQAFYSGDSNYIPAEGSTSETVDQGTATVTITPSVNPAPTPQVVVYKVVVAGVVGFAPTGSVTVSDGTRICTISTLSAKSKGNCHIDEPKGKYVVTATYNGNVNYGTSSGSVNEKIK
ncbi:MAG: Ig-like domain repeat protein [Acidimicrobiales bacterium]